MPIKLDKVIEDTLGTVFGKDGISAFRNIDFAKSYLWSVRFEEAGSPNSPAVIIPAPFNDFFPAETVAVPPHQITEYQFNQYLSQYSVPQGMGLRTIAVSFYDDDNATLFKWFEDWVVLDILNKGYFVSAILDNHYCVGSSKDDIGKDSFGNIRQVKPIRTMTLKLENAGRDTVMRKTYRVFPRTSPAYEGNSANSTATIFRVELVIVGESATQSPQEPSLLSTAKKLAKNALGGLI